MVRGQIYDGAASMSGHLSGVAKLFKDDVNERFLYIFTHIGSTLFIKMLVNKLDV